MEYHWEYHEQLRSFTDVQSVEGKTSRPTRYPLKAGLALCPVI